MTKDDIFNHVPHATCQYFTRHKRKKWNSVLGLYKRVAYSINKVFVFVFIFENKQFLLYSRNYLTKFFFFVLTKFNQMTIGSFAFCNINIKISNVSKHFHINIGPF